MLLRFTAWLGVRLVIVLCLFTVWLGVHSVIVFCYCFFFLLLLTNQHKTAFRKTTVLSQMLNQSFKRLKFAHGELFPMQFP